MSIFERRHYKELARVIHDSKLAQLDKAYIAACLSDTFYKDNPRFNRRKFMEALFPVPNHDAVETGNAGLSEPCCGGRCHA